MTIYEAVTLLAPMLNKQSLKDKTNRNQSGTFLKAKNSSIFKTFPVLNFYSHIIQLYHP